VNPLIDEDVLNDPAHLAAADRSGMLRALATGGAQVRRAVTAAAETDTSRVAGAFRPRAVVVAGIGVSGVAGDVLCAIVGSTSSVLVTVHRDAGLPGWVGAADAVVGVSASGSSEETLSAVGEGIRRDAAVIGIGATDSPLAELCATGRAPFLGWDPELSSRSSLWFLAASLLAVTRDCWGLHQVPDSDLMVAADRLDGVANQCRPGSEVFVNPAKSAALELSGCVPVLVGTSPLAGVAAYRFASQLAVNARWPSTWGVLPEAGRTMVGVLEGPFAARESHDIFHDPVESGPAAIRLRLILMRDSVEHPVIGARADALTAAAQDRGVSVAELRAEGANPVERLASLVAPTDYTSVYLALAGGIDPTPARIREETEGREVP
jgi:glucose/mannose-6-phosphate isomerase